MLKRNLLYRNIQITHLDEVKKNFLKVEEMDVYKNGTLFFPKDEPINIWYEGDDNRNDMKDILTAIITLKRSPFQQHGSLYAQGSTSYYRIIAPAVSSSSTDT